MWKIILCDGIKNNIRIIRIIASYERAVQYAINLHNSTGKMYKVERV
jgi:hypothetical protein